MAKRIKNPIATSNNASKPIVKSTALSASTAGTQPGVASAAHVAKKTTRQATQQPSRKGKKAWRKNVDLAELEENLEDKRTEDRLGLGQKDSSDLFFTDTTGDHSVRKELKLKVMRVDEILRIDSAIPGVMSRKSIRSSARAITNTDKDIMTAKKATRKASKSMVKQVSMMAEKKRDAGLGPGSAAAARKRVLEAKAQVLKRAKGGYDLWGDDAANPAASDTKTASTTLPAHASTTSTTTVTADLSTGRVHPSKVRDGIDTDFVEPILIKPVRKPDIEKQVPVAIPAVRVSHPGASYNPDAVAHQRAIHLAANIEYGKMDTEERVRNQMAYPPELDDLDDETYFDDTDDEEEEEAVETGDVDTAMETTPSTKQTAPDPKRKTKPERNREARIAARRLQTKQMQETKTLMKQLGGIGQIQSQLKKENKTRSQRYQSRKLRESTQASSQPRKLGRHAFKPASVEIQLTDEIADSLRVLKPEGNLFVDRFKSLQERNLIETRVPVRPRRRYQLKITESHDYKRFK